VERSEVICREVRLQPFGRQHLFARHAARVVDQQIDAIGERRDPLRRLVHRGDQ
jgi:hypothetical protein